MNDKRYVLDIEKIIIDFSIDKDTKSLTHKQCNTFKLLPYAANEKSLFTEFKGVTGAFWRLICNKELNMNFDKEDFINNVVDQIGEYDKQDNREEFKKIISTMFIDNDNLVDFNINTINYTKSSKAEEKMAKFIYSIFYDEEIKELSRHYYDRPSENILYRLLFNSLPKLNEKRAFKEEYYCYLSFVKEQFLKDFKYLLSDDELYKNSIQRFLEFYYFYYMSQLSIKLGKFEKADIKTPDKIYFTLSWESTSKTRTSYIYGWEKLKSYSTKLFSHAITLELLNHCNINEQLDYITLYEIFEQDNDLILEELKELCDLYMECRQEGIDWESFKFKNNNYNRSFDYVYKLFEEIEYQFHGKNSTRTRAYEAYSNWFVKFVEKNFGKRRGSLGYTLSLTEEDIILLTKLCINDNYRIKVSNLFEEFEKRGVSFDKDSQIKIIQLYEKLNLLEKKSDSGDAQYVRSIL